MRLGTTNQSTIFAPADGLRASCSLRAARAHPLVFLLALAQAGLISTALPAAEAIPEPPVVLYGRVSPAVSVGDLAKVSFTVAGNRESAKSGRARVVSVNGSAYYLVAIPFETRAVRGLPEFSASPGTLGLTAGDTTYILSAKVDGRAADIADGNSKLVYGTRRQGLVRRVDLVLAGTKAPRAPRSSMVSAKRSTTGAGEPAAASAVLPTQPSAAVPVVRDFALLPGGAIGFSWDTLPGFSYRVERSTDLKPDGWQPVNEAIKGDGSTMNFIDSQPVQSDRLFYRIAVTLNDSSR